MNRNNEIMTTKEREASVKSNGIGNLISYGNKSANLRKVQIDNISNKSRSASRSKSPSHNIKSNIINSPKNEIEDNLLDAVKITKLYTHDENINIKMNKHVGLKLLKRDRNKSNDK
jgi:hypothetical protein